MRTLPRLNATWKDSPELLERYWDEMANLIEEIQQDRSVENSYVDDFTAPLISCDSSGNVTIANHDRVYGSPAINPTVAVTGGSLVTSASVGDVIDIYYKDPTRRGGAVTYLFYLNRASLVYQTGEIHSLGTVTVPSSGTANGSVIRPNGLIES